MRLIASEGHQPSVCFSAGCAAGRRGQRWLPACVMYSRSSALPGARAVLRQEMDAIAVQRRTAGRSS